MRKFDGKRKHGLVKVIRVNGGHSFGICEDCGCVVPLSECVPTES